MVYQWKFGSRISADPQAAGEMCKRLETEGRLTAKNLLEENRPEDAPLHNAFEWNDGIAAEKWREQQARHIIHSLVVCKEKTEPVRGFFHIERSENTYHSVETICQSKGMTEQLFQTAIRELTSVQKKYSSIKQLQKVWTAIDESKQSFIQQTT